MLANVACPKTANDIYAYILSLSPHKSINLTPSVRGELARGPSCVPWPFRLAVCGASGKVAEPLDSCLANSGAKT